MTEQVENQNQQIVEQKSNTAELNFRKMEKMYERQLEAERLEKERLRQELEQRSRQVVKDEDEDDDEPYVDKKKLEKKLSKFGQSTQTEIQKAMELAKQKAKEELKQEIYLENNPDFYSTLQLAEKFAEKAPRLAESILRMPEGFERQKLVYENIKALGLHQPEQKQPSIQEKIDANRRSPYYQPSNVAAAPYAATGDFSPSGQKNAYEKMKELKSRLRLG